MKAAVLREAPGRLGIEDVSRDEPGPREVVVRTAAAGLCHSHLHFMEALHAYPPPAILGHESAGVIELVSARIKMEEINDGFANMKAGAVARSVIVFD